ncbi:TPA: hypothetical protein ACL4D1_001149 [Streptococcus pneumoniae]
MKFELINDHFENAKRYNIPRAQLIIADIPYNLGNNAYASDPRWYENGDNKNGESKLAGKSFFDTDNDFKINNFEVKSKFAPQNGVATTILIGRDFDTGQVHANELKSTVPGQMYFDENGEILTDIGQPVAEIEQQAETKPDIIDFNKKKVGN